MNPQRKPAQSRPTEKAAAGGMDARQVGSPAGGRRTAAAFSSLGAAASNSACNRVHLPDAPTPMRRSGGKTDGATISIRSRNRHLASRAVRRLGFAPIPGRRSNSNPGAFRGERAALIGSASASGLPVANEHRGARACSGTLARSLDQSGANPKGGDVVPDTRQPAAGIKPGRARIISTTRRDTCRGCGGRKEWCDCRERTACERARGSTDPRRPSVDACRARNSFSRMISRLGAGRRTPDLDIRPAPSPLASGDALCMTRVGHGFIGSANKNVGGAK